MTPEEREELRAQRADASRAFIILWFVLVVIVGSLAGLMVWAGL